MSRSEFFLAEGKANLQQCIMATLRAAHDSGLRKVIIFTAEGEGIVKALELINSVEAYKDIELIAVTFPPDYPFPANQHPVIPSDRERHFKAKGIPIIRQPLPFEGTLKAPTGDEIKGTLIRATYNTICGGLALCVQSALMACDAEVVAEGEHVFAASADTAILVQACKSEHFFQGLVIREILCKPMILTVVKKEVVPKPEEKALPPTPEKEFPDSSEKDKGDPTP